MLLIQAPCFEKPGGYTWSPITFAPIVPSVNSLILVYHVLTWLYHGAFNSTTFLDLSPYSHCNVGTIKSYDYFYKF